MKVNESLEKASSWRRVLKWFGYGFGGLFVVMLLFVMVVVPLLGGSVVSGQVSKRIAGELSLQRIWINPFRCSVSLKGISLRGPDGVQVIGLNRVLLNVDPLGSLVARELRAQAFVVDGARIDLLVDERGELSLLEAVAMAAGAETQTELEPQPAAEAQPIPEAWLGLLSVSNVVIHFEDRSRSPIFNKTIDPIAFSMENIRTGPEGASQLLFSAQTTADEYIRIDGTFQMEPLSVSGQLDVGGIQLADYSAFVEELANAALADGRVRLKADYAFTVNESGVAAQLRDGEVVLEQLLVQMTGQASLNARLAALGLTGITVDVGLPAEGELSVAASVDCRLSGFEAQFAGDEQPFVSFSELLVDGIDFEMLPMALRIPEVALVDLLVVADRDAGGTFKAMQLSGERAEVVPEPAALESGTVVDPDEPESGPGFDLHIGKVSLVNGGLRFRDASVSPTADLQIHPLNVTVTPVTLDAATASSVELSAVIEEEGELLLESELHLLDPSVATTATIDISGIPLTSFASYSAQFTGRPIKQGTFKAAFDYEVADNQLNAGNVLTVQQIRFGDTVPGYTGKNYPLGTAVAVLENMRGEIVLDVPLSGALDDPDFQPAKIIINTLTGLVLKAITAPLNIASRLGGSVISNVVGLASGGESDAGPDYSRVPFVIGSESLVDSDGKDLLPVVAKMLNSRPMLILSVQGSVDPERDSVAIQTDLLEKKLAEMPGESREEKMLQAYRLLVSGERPGPVAEPDAEVAVEPPVADAEGEASATSSVANEASAAEPRPGFYLRQSTEGDLSPVVETFYTRGGGRAPRLRQVVRVEPKSAPATSADAPVGQPSSGPAGKSADEAPSISTMQQELMARLFTDAALGDLARSRAETVVRSLGTEYGVDAERLQVQQVFQRNGAAVLFELNTRSLD
jgi:hypothetical protein